MLVSSDVYQDKWAPAAAENKSYSGSGSGFSTFFDSGSEKMQNPAGVDSGTLDPWPPLTCCAQCAGAEDI